MHYYTAKMNYDITYHYRVEFRVNVLNLWSPAFELHSIVVLLIDIIRFTYFQKSNYSTNDSWFYSYIVKLETEASFLTDIISNSLDFFDFLMRPLKIETGFLLFIYLIMLKLFDMLIIIVFY